MAEAHISLQNGSNLNGGTFALGQDFYWANPSVTQAVTVYGCGGFCVDDAYAVPAAPTLGAFGLKKATLLAQPTDWSFGPEQPNMWNAPGMPHIQQPPWPTPKPLEHDREVA
jgi:hypothetical protein